MIIIRKVVIFKRFWFVGLVFRMLCISEQWKVFLHSLVWSFKRWVKLIEVGGWLIGDHESSHHHDHLHFRCRYCSSAHKRGGRGSGGTFSFSSLAHSLPACGHDGLEPHRPVARIVCLLAPIVLHCPTFCCSFSPAFSRSPSLTPPCSHYLLLWDDHFRFKKRHVAS